MEQQHLGTYVRILDNPYTALITANETKNQPEELSIYYIASRYSIWNIEMVLTAFTNLQKSPDIPIIVLNAFSAPSRFGVCSVRTFGC